MPRATRTLFPHIYRSLAEIKPSLHECLRLLVDGEIKWPLYLHGPAGVGKTCAALVLADYCTRPCYETPGSFSEKIDLARNDKLEWFNEGRGGKITLKALWESLRSPDLFILDEIGTRGNVSDAQYETVKRIFDERYPAPAIYISNVDLTQIEKIYDDRLSSRLSCGTVFCLDAADRRQD